MRRFIKHLIYFILAFCIAQIFLLGIVLKDVGIPYAHNKRFTTKYHYYKQHENRYNTLFLGSSRTYREINPQRIDDQLVAYGIQSFNLGAPATFNPESFYLLKTILENKSKDAPLKYIILELGELSPTKFVNWFAPQSFYFMNNMYLYLICSVYLTDKDINILTKATKIFPFLQGYILKLLFLLPEMKVAPESEIFLGPGRNGFYALDQDLLENANSRLQQRRMNFLNDSSAVQSRINAQQRDLVPINNQVYFDYLNTLINEAEAQGVELFYIIPPKLKNYPKLKQFQYKIRNHHVIDMGSHALYPDLYRTEYWFDQGHFNSFGADVYTGYVAKAIEDKLHHIEIQD